MQNMFMEKLNRWLLPMVLILFVLQLMTLPWAVGFTWADTSADYTIVYTENKLAWETPVNKLPDGTVVIDLFEPEYDGTVKSQDGGKVVAPGTANSQTIRLQNNVSGPITYTAVLYEIKTDPSLPVTATVSASGAADAASYPLPSGVTQDQVVQAITGTVSGRQRVDFATAWSWTFEESTRQDAMDTLLGNQASAEVTVGLYIVVEDNNSYVTPENPKTGDSSNVSMYAVLMAVSFVLLILLLWERRREEESEISN